MKRVQGELGKKLLTTGCLNLHSKLCFMTYTQNEKGEDVGTV